MKPNITELRFIAELLRAKHAEWSKLPTLDTGSSIVDNPVSRHFKMDIWFGKCEHDCGFAGCAIGTYLTFAAERAANLGLFLYNDSPISRQGTLGIEAVAEVFHLTMFDCQHLFYASYYPDHKRYDPLYVADRIDKFCNDKEASDEYSEHAN